MICYVFPGSPGGGRGQDVHQVWTLTSTNPKKTLGNFNETSYVGAWAHLLETYRGFLQAGPLGGFSCDKGRGRGAIFGKSVLALKLGFAVGEVFSKHQRHTPELRRP